MPELIEQMYCSQQIIIPPKFPYMLKRYCKAAIKTQPYDLLRWSFEYFKALAANKPPPVKLRLEYPIYSTEGGLTKGCLKVMAQQLSTMEVLPLPVVRSAWRGFCLDPLELVRILCLCEVHMREETVPYLHFIAVAGGFLTKCLSHTMILLCETLTKEPDGGSAAIPVDIFLKMYKFLAGMDASKDIKYLDGYREGETPEAEETQEEESSTETDSKESTNSGPEQDDFWPDHDLRRLSLIDDNVSKAQRVSEKLNRPIFAELERYPSLEVLKEIEREAFMRDRKERYKPSEAIEKKLRQMSLAKMASSMAKIHDEFDDESDKGSVMEEVNRVPVIFVFDEEDQPLPVTYGYESEEEEVEEETVEEQHGEEPSDNSGSSSEQVKEEEVDEAKLKAEKLKEFLETIEREREERILDLEKTFDEIGEIVDKFKSVNYDLGMVAGRQMSTTSGEFVAKHIERDIMDYINEQIAILPDPNLKKRKATPEERMMVREILEDFLDENMEVIIPELEEAEEEEQIIPEIITVYAVPGIGSPVEEQIVETFVEYIEEVTVVQANLVMPRNLRHFLCPPLENLTEPNYEMGIRDEGSPRYPKKVETLVEPPITK